ncbi:hypothetical protein X798_01214 [Onchocerca flexuosa]|uniref:Major sperm protein n=2 Tax=Onchocerca flexuosa TaxID=387005 RepID=A0A183HDX1_9BILA|nr:hypothetical protein X798_01214 [Onchocerca flexuosa]VDO43953.1 unnamed protein product [Onchocerca flexuosa]
MCDNSLLFAVGSNLIYFITTIGVGDMKLGGKCFFIALNNIRATQGQEPAIKVYAKKNDVDVDTQTENDDKEYVPQWIRMQNPEALLIDKLIITRDDVNDLTV